MLYIYFYLLRPSSFLRVRLLSYISEKRGQLSPSPFDKPVPKREKELEKLKSLLPDTALASF